MSTQHRGIQMVAFVFALVFVIYFFGPGSVPWFCFGWIVGMNYDSK